MKAITETSLKCLLLVLTSVLCWNTSKSQGLEELLMRADTANPSIREAQLQYQSAAERLAGAGILPDPQLTVSVAGRHLETRLGPQQARITLMQMFPWFGSLNAEKQQEAIMAQVAYQEYLAKRNTLFFELSQSYYDLYELRKTAALLRESLELMGTMEDVALQQYQEAKASMVDVLKIQIRKEEMETELMLIVERGRLLERTISLLLDEPTTMTIQVADTLPIPSITSGNGIEGNPELNAIRQMRQATDWRISLAKKNGLPMFGLGFDYIMIGKGEGIMLEDNGRDAWMPMLTLGLPIYRKKYQAEIRSAEVIAESLDAGYGAKRNELLSEMEEVDYEVLKSAAMLELLGAKIEKTTQALSIQLTGYAANGQQFEDLLLSRQQLLSLQIEKEKVLVEALKNEAKRKYLTNSYSLGTGTN